MRIVSLGRNLFSASENSTTALGLKPRPSFFRAISVLNYATKLIKDTAMLSLQIFFPHERQ